MAADHYRLPRPVGPSPGIQLGAARPSTADAVRALLLERARNGWLETFVLATLWLVAVGIRLPHLWTVPTLGGDADQLLALARSQVDAWPAPGSAFSSVGATHELLFAAAFAVVGPSPYLPRFVTAIQAALTVPLVYVLTRELCRPLGKRRIEEAFVMPRLAGLVAAGLLATSAAHVVVTSHAARAESFTPFLVVGLLFAVEKALNGSNGRWLLLAGALFGLALQTSPLVLAILPGLLLASWWQARSLLLSYWSAVAVLGFAGAYAGTLATTLQDGSAPGAVSVGSWLPVDAGQSPTGQMYLDSVGVALVAVWRMLVGQLTTRPPAADVLSDPLAWPFVALAILGVLVLVLRGRPLLPLTALSCLVILPYVSAEPNVLVNGRYLMPVALVSIVAIGVAVGALAPGISGRGSLPRLALGMMLGGLVLAPLSGLRTFYDESAAAEQTSDGLLRVPRAVFDERRYDEVVLLDERLARHRLGAGGNVLEALQYLLTVSGVPTRTTFVNAGTLRAAGTTDRVLIVLDHASVPVLAAGARLTPLLDEWIDSEDSPASAMLFRAERVVQRFLLDEDSLRVFAASGI